MPKGRREKRLRQYAFAALAISICAALLLSAPNATAATAWTGSASPSQSSSTLTITSKFAAPSNANSEFTLATFFQTSSGKTVSQWRAQPSVHANQQLSYTYKRSTSGLTAGTYTVKQGVWAGSWGTQLIWRNAATVTIRGQSASSPPASTPPATSVSPPVSKSSTKPVWLINDAAITHLRDAGASQSLIDSTVDSPSSFVIENSKPPATGIPTVTYASYADIQSAFGSGKLPGGYKAVIYDNESWSATPAAEQQNPAKYEQLVSALVHKHGMLFIATPAVDLVSTLNPGSSNQGNSYLSDGLASSAARYADVIDIQAQRFEGNTTEYKSFVTAAAAQARNANPKVVVLAGLSTNPSGASISSAQLSATYSSVRPIVDGYWLNIPGQTSQCPNCGTPNPQPAVDLLKQIAG